MDNDQQTKLTQLRTITSKDHGEQDIQVLESVGWDVQKAVELLFDEPPPSTAVPSQSTGRGVEQFQIDEPNYNTRPPTSMTGSIALSILSWPITFTFNFLSYLLRLLRIPIPRVFSRPLSVVLNWNAFASLWKPARRDPPGIVAERWVRTLEDEVGALTWARLRAADAIPDSVKEIPDFYLGSYGDVLNTAKRELKILCVVLLSDEHDDVPRFKRETLTDPDFNALLRQEGMLVWGGDVHDVEPYSAGLKLNATTYPFVAFVALHPVRTRSLATSAGPPQNVMSVLSRHSGSTETTPQALVQHLQGKLLPHMRPVLEKYRLEEMTRETDRKEREESEQRAFLAGQRDSERILRLREERERKEREAELKIREAENLEREQERKRITLASRRTFWKHSAATSVESTSPNTRITIRLPDGRRAIHQFNDKQPIGDLYSFVASELAVSLPDLPGEEVLPAYDVNKDGWGFTIATSYPRVQIPWSSSSNDTLTDIEGGALRNGALLVVEMENGESSTAGDTTNAPTDDDYLSEED